MDSLERGYWHMLAPLLIIGAGVFWGMIGVFSRSLAEAGLNALQITMARCSISVITLLLFLVMTDRRKLIIKLHDLWLFVGTGVFSIVFFNICYFFCISESTLSIACTLLYTSPCFVMLLSCLFLHERFTIRKGIAAILAFSGCMFITGVIGGNSEMNVKGIVLVIGLGSGIGYALYSIIGRIALKKYSWLTVITYTFLFASIALMPFSKSSELFHIVYSSSNVVFNAVSLGILSTLLPFLLYTKGLEHMDTSRAALLTFVEPVVAMIIGITIYHEIFTWNIAIGIMFVILSIVIINFKHNRTVVTEPK